MLISFLIILTLGVVAFGGYCWFDYLKNNVDNSNSEQIKDDSNEPEEFRWVECYAREHPAKAYDYLCVLITSDNRLAIASCMMKDDVLCSYDILDPNNKDRYFSGPFVVYFITKTTVLGSDRIITFKEDLSENTEYQLTISGDELTFQEGYRYANKPFTRSVIPKFIGKYEV